jgi:hypothetical protein
MARAHECSCEFVIGFRDFASQTEPGVPTLPPRLWGDDGRQPRYIGTRRHFEFAKLFILAPERRLIFAPISKSMAAAASEIRRSIKDLGASGAPRAGEIRTPATEGGYHPDDSNTELAATAEADGFGVSLYQAGASNIPDMDRTDPLDYAPLSFHPNTQILWLTFPTCRLLRLQFLNARCDRREREKVLRCAVEVVASFCDAIVRDDHIRDPLYVAGSSG